VNYRCGTIRPAVMPTSEIIETKGRVTGPI